MRMNDKGKFKMAHKNLNANKTFRGYSLFISGLKATENAREPNAQIKTKVATFTARADFAWNQSPH